jgi:hypothetical protein
MDRFAILREIPYTPGPTAWVDQISSMKKFVIEDFNVVIVNTNHLKILSQINYPILDLLNGHIQKPYAVFVSDSLTEDLLKDLFIKNHTESGFLLYRKFCGKFFDDKHWTIREMEHFHSLGFNFLKYVGGEGFHIWSDNIIGSTWGGLEIQHLSSHRIISYIVKNGGDLYSKYIIAKSLNLEVEGNPFISFTLRLPGEIKTLTGSLTLTDQPELQ